MDVWNVREKLWEKLRSPRTLGEMFFCKQKSTIFCLTKHNNKTRHKHVTYLHTSTFLQKTGGRAIAAKARSAWRSVASPPGLGLPSAGSTAGAATVGGAARGSRAPHGAAPAAQHGAQHGVSSTAVPPGFLPPQVSSCASAPHVSSHRRLTCEDVFVQFFKQKKRRFASICALFSLLWMFFFMRFVLFLSRCLKRSCS